MKINERFEIVNDYCSWEVREYKGGINSRTKQIGTTPQSTWHMTLEQACIYVLNNSMKVDTKETETVLSSIRKAVRDIKEALKTLPELHRNNNEQIKGV